MNLQSIESWFWTIGSENRSIHQRIIGSIINPISIPGNQQDVIESWFPMSQSRWKTEGSKSPSIDASAEGSIQDQRPIKTHQNKSWFLINPTVGQKDRIRIQINWASNLAQSWCSTSFPLPRRYGWGRRKGSRKLTTNKKSQLDRYLRDRDRCRVVLPRCRWPGDRYRWQHHSWRFSSAWSSCPSPPWL